MVRSFHVADSNPFLDQVSERLRSTSALPLVLYAVLLRTATTDFFGQ
jgi:hypothetical protein